MTRGARIVVRAALLGAALLLAPAVARADVRVGLYAPSAPFAGTSARLDYVTRLADHLAAATGEKGHGRVFSRAADFAAAVKAGELDLAVVDAPYLAAIGVPYDVLATATRDGAAATSWQVVTRGRESKLADLAGKRVLCPSVGGHETAFIHDALLDAELRRGFFARIDSSPDAVSALAALGLGRADAAIVPGTVDLPARVTRVATLPEVPWPVLVSLRGTAADAKKRATAAGTFAGGAVLDGFTTAASSDLSALARGFRRTERRGPMVLPTLRVTLDALLTPRAPTIPRPSLLPLLAPPAALPPPDAAP